MTSCRPRKDHLLALAPPLTCEDRRARRSRILARRHFGGQHSVEIWL